MVPHRRGMSGRIRYDDEPDSPRVQPKGKDDADEPSGYRSGSSSWPVGVVGVVVASGSERLHGSFSEMRIDRVVSPHTTPSSFLFRRRSEAFLSGGRTRLYPSIRHHLGRPRRFHLRTGYRPVVARRVARPEGDLPVLDRDQTRHLIDSVEVLRRARAWEPYSRTARIGAL